MIARARPLAALFALALVAFWPLVVNPDQTLYSDTSDLLAEHLPAKLFLIRSLRETGELPLWNPEQYAGSPFVHDIQVGLFYPPHLPLYFISEPAVGPFLSWLLFVHVVLAGWLMYAYGRHAGLGGPAAFVAGAGYMLSPRWMMQLFLAGHTVTQGICWIPLVLLCVERAIRRRDWRWAVGGGAAWALLVLGTHPQWAFYGSLLIGVWPLRLLVRERASPERPEQPSTLAADYGELTSAGSTPSPPASGGEGRGEGGRGSPGRETASVVGEPQPPSPSSPPRILLPPKRGERGDGSPTSTRLILIRWFVAELIVVAVGLALCAVQLLPTIEAAGQSSRARGMGQSWSRDGAKAAALTLVGPVPARTAEPIHWETRGGIGFGWAVFAIVGAWFGGRRARVPAAIALGMLAYALGGSYFIDRLPGFDNFRMPTRMLLTLAFPVAFLAGIGVEAMRRERARRVAVWSSLVVLVYVVNGGFLEVLKDDLLNHIDLWPIRFTWGYWLLILAAWIGFLAFGGRVRSATVRRWLPAGLLVGDLLIGMPGHDYVLEYEVATLDRIYPASPITDYIRANNPDGRRVLDSAELLGPGSPSASALGIPSVLGYNPLDVARYRQFLAFVADQGEPQFAFSGEFTHPVVDQLNARNDSLFHLLGVRYLIADDGFDPGDDSGWQPLDRPDFDAPARPGYSFLGPGLALFERRKYTLWENRNVLPRAFVVTKVAPQAGSDPDVLAQLKATDFRGTALVDADGSPMPELPPAAGATGPAVIRSHSPNQIHVALDGQTAGLLVLTDPWYPGWKCYVDGQETKIWMADYAFRGVMVPAGSKEVVFKFEPRSYRRGRIISLGALAGLTLFGVACLRRR